MGLREFLPERAKSALQRFYSSSYPIGHNRDPWYGGGYRAPLLLRVGWTLRFSAFRMCIKGLRLDTPDKDLPRAQRGSTLRVLRLLGTSRFSPKGPKDTIIRYFGCG